MSQAAPVFLVVSQAATAIRVPASVIACAPSILNQATAGSDVTLILPNYLDILQALPSNGGLATYTTLNASYTQPAAGSTVTITVRDSSITSVNATLYVQGGGYYLVTAVPSGTTITIKNLGQSGNKAAGATIANGSSVRPNGYSLSDNFVPNQTFQFEVFNAASSTHTVTIAPSADGTVVLANATNVTIAANARIHLKANVVSITYPLVTYPVLVQYWDNPSATIPTTPSAASIIVY